ncbi:hypothetical protein BE17_52800 [Sorangium cellulosum]|uniref:Uncharacterized protein n=1 Tax=Sorangium cellulosum TaxID=56 RepID=A0A150QSA1_SORCE|nr:hypothetical protein BE17_52800 [Sorangium cellulosum]
MFLKTGDVVRGSLIAVEPDERVVILVRDQGTVRTLVWSEVDHLERGDAPPPGRPPPPSAPGASAAPLPSVPGLARIHIDTDDPQVRLIKLVSTEVSGGFRSHSVTRHVEVVCRAPCDEVVDGRRGEAFYFSGKGMPDSSEFTLLDVRGDSTIHVDSGSNFQYRIATPLMVLGGIAVLGGAAATIAAFKTDSSDGAKAGSLAFNVLGASVLATGILMRVFGRTTYEFVPLGPAQRVPGPQAGPNGLLWRF